jgi:hypothetical protein
MSEENTVIYKGSVFKVEKLTSFYKDHLNEKAQTLMDKKSEKLSFEENGVFYEYITLAVTVNRGNNILGVEALAPAINELAESGVAHSVLAPLSYMELWVTDLQLKNSVFCFLMVPQEKIEELKKKYKYIQEVGSCGDYIDTPQQLESGEFYTDLSISESSLLVDKFLSSQDCLEKQIDKYLAILPGGTTVKETVLLTNVDLYTRYKIVFNNPLMKKVKRVEFLYTRDCCLKGETLHQYSVLTKVNYYDKEDKLMYN